jgi:hypothetical protein
MRESMAFEWLTPELLYSELRPRLSRAPIQLHLSVYSWEFCFELCPVLYLACPSWWLCCSLNDLYATPIFAAPLTLYI